MGEDSEENGKVADPNGKGSSGQLLICFKLLHPEFWRILNTFEEKHGSRQSYDHLDLDYNFVWFLAPYICIPGIHQSLVELKCALDYGHILQYYFLFHKAFCKRIAFLPVSVCAHFKRSNQLTFPMFQEGLHKSPLQECLRRHTLISSTFSFTCWFQYGFVPVIHLG